MPAFHGRKKSIWISVVEVSEGVVLYQSIREIIRGITLIPELNAATVKLSCVSIKRNLIRHTLHFNNVVTAVIIKLIIRNAGQRRITIWTVAIWSVTIRTIAAG